MDALITVLPGDGIGYEVTQSGRDVLDAIARSHGHNFRYEEQLIGGAAIDATGDPLPPDTRASCLESDAVLMGAVGGPQWSDPNAAVTTRAGPTRRFGRCWVFLRICGR